jgi:seryl-tRNA synthetase
MNADADLVVALFDKRTALVTDSSDAQPNATTTRSTMKGKLSDDERKKLIDEGQVP